jgi:deoxyhypusine synthase
MKVVKDFRVDKKTTVRDLVKQMYRSGGFQAKNLAIGIDILKEMINQKDCLRFLSFPACIISTGTRGVIKDFVRKKFFDVIITTCGTLDHDLARSFKPYYHGTFFADDVELHKKGIHRLGNVFVPKESYGIIIEKKMKEFLDNIFSKGLRDLGTHELCWKLGKFIKNKDSILYWSWKNKIPIIVPGITDGAVGYQLWQFSQDHDFRINLMKDESLLSDFVWNAKKSGALIIGGGISKHHVIWWGQFAKGLDYSVYITTAIEGDGSLSGARPREAISWSKIKEKAKHVTIEGDATVYLPIILASLI